jgi:uncharacterized protein YcbK (DUF882 family)
MHRTPEEAGRPAVSRRSFLTLGLGMAAAAVVTDPVQAAVRLFPERSLSLYNIHTGEHLNAVYWSNGHYVKESLSRINHLMRDFRSGHAHPIDPHVLDLVMAVQRKCDARGPIHVVSGYRSPETNAWLASVSDGVAANSLHMRGKAIDFRLPGHNVRTIGRAARSLKGGGVGIYPASDFVHVDCGRVRYW